MKLADTPEYCFDCGKRLASTRKEKLAVNYNNSRGRVILPTDEPEGDDWGFLPVGRECAKKFPQAYVIHVEKMALQ